ncbi:BZ3500_MvSof-1268-A1-R1_Chr2-1g04442 [Microbotryum saponariae]|uniref:BZ3500_MvSof-1268-A1-R1_Chr2-1g04442 protein n=1 Tax=Microbotryum saponariae TaxID=289078 RepID=A0A2X0K8M9_9BASI|nr:BZ3500_MvSof-1268-A1-R1_Chr2-1g04442 [Microbotryum saponariae]SCZ91717.1 BZ3501_MvSof-1269-A2-R1_Chr2-1g04098 [Microbotryum saponariae]
MASTSSNPIPPEAGFPPLTKADVIACAFSSWYPTFRRHSPKATVIAPLSDEFIDYLQSDGVFLPEGSGPMGLVAQRMIKSRISELSDSEDDESANGTESSDDQSWQVSFPKLDSEIRDVLFKYDGAAFPKLNWSSPRDAAWMLPGQNLKCQTPADVYLLLKSSDFITHDLDHAFDLCVEQTPSTLPDSSVGPVEGLAEGAGGLTLSDDETDEDSDEKREGRRIRSRRPPSLYPFELVLKKWYDIPRSQEWRCFVRDKQLIAISQRDTNYYDFLQPDSVTEELEDQISDFFEKEIQPVFPSTNYVFDLYLTRARDRFFILDFNPYSSTTDALLFTWSELNEIVIPTSDASRTSTLPEIRIVTSAAMLANQALPAFSHNRYPKDVVELSDGASIAEFAKEWAARLEEGVLDGLKQDEDGRDEVEELAGR